MSVMGRHSLDQADSRWVSLLEHMNSDDQRSGDAIPIPASLLLEDVWWIIAHTRHARQSLASAWCNQMVILAWLIIAELLDALVQLIRYELPLYVSVRRLLHFAVVMTPASTHGRASNDPGTLYERPSNARWDAHERRRSRHL